MSDADDQTGGSGDPRFDEPPASKSKGKALDKDQSNDNDLMTEDDLPSGG
jgi:hypothetical protein